MLDRMRAAGENMELDGTKMNKTIWTINENQWQFMNILENLSYVINIGIYVIPWDIYVYIYIYTWGYCREFWDGQLEEWTSTEIFKGGVPMSDLKSLSWWT